MSSNLIDFICDESKEDLLEILIEDFNTLKKFDDYIKVLSFYRVERCKQDDCLQCLFAINLRYVYNEHIITDYCIMRKENLIASKLFIRRLAELERSRTELKKQFRETLSLWNKKKTRCRVLP